MTKRALCRALLLGIALEGQVPLQAQTLPAEIPEAPRLTELPNGTGQREPDQKDATRPGFPPVSPRRPLELPIPLAGSLDGSGENLQCKAGLSSLADARLCCDPEADPFARYLSSESSPLTPREKFILAERNIRDPFNLLTIGGEAAITIGSDAHTPYGPGFPGFGKYAGVSFTQEMVGQFFGTFLIPSLAHQDPHYRRMPNLPIKRRIFHVLDAVLISESDEGQRMFNYATVFGTIGTSALGNLYVPGRETDWGASADRVAVALATDPIGNAIAEFLPDVARRININVVLVQRVINRVAIDQGASPAQ